MRRCTLNTRDYDTTMGCTWPFSITFITQKFCFSSLCFCHWQFVPPLSILRPLWSLFHCSSWPFVYRMNKGQRLKMSSQLGLCSSTDLTRLLLKWAQAQSQTKAEFLGHWTPGIPRRWFRSNVEEDASASFHPNSNHESVVVPAYHLHGTR